MQPQHFSLCVTFGKLCEELKEIRNNCWWCSSPREPQHWSCVHRSWSKLVVELWVRFLTPPDVNHVYLCVHVILDIFKNGITFQLVDEPGCFGLFIVALHYFYFLQLRLSFVDEILDKMSLPWFSNRSLKSLKSLELKKANQSQINTYK